MSDSKHRNTSLDAVKAIAAISVVFLHYNHVDGEIGEIYTRLIFNITTFAVPFFFMITGYFLIALVENHRDKGYLKKILQMALCSTAFYFVYNVVVSGDGLDWIKNHYTIGSVFTWLTGQDDPAGFHLWYFYCLLWSFTIVTFIYKLFNVGALYALALIMLVYHFSGAGMFSCYTVSIPAMVLGIALYKNKTLINRVPANAVFGCAIVMLFLMGLEAYYNIGKPGFYYEGHILALIIFILAMRIPSALNSSGLAYIGLECSALIYILHVFVNGIFSFVIDYRTIPLQVLKPWIVFGGSLGLAMICGYVSKLKLNYGAYKD